MKANKSVDSTPLPDRWSARFGVIYVVLFLAIFGALDYGYYLTRGTLVEHLLIDTLTVTHNLSYQIFMKYHTTYS